ncbi:uncharacterized protein LOC116165931 isoform X4 [Photinus pyralis]|uniref:uncharacterized protein LOC116165931 isoform X2 n=1 Tax=Photinus pyralis TaxID=7054 RepID=UPI0012675C94|nr:uncharacterized protein LOC116165931 isoform X2 [Photinus pyralis]XP_031336560.1 uncharacterized protein LOC116165931 isoform X3 [Photinus pyralis]XP_031336561.1 uncharacterized protein LOC116165931 isoform X4 [Photinus pyralis]
MLLTLIFARIVFALPTPENNESDGQISRKVLGSSVVTSVSVIMDSGNGSQTLFADAVGKPMTKPSAATQLASPINLLNPDRYEFYTFDDSGDLVRRLMTLDEIQGIIASGDGDATNYNSQPLLTLPEQRVDDVINNVQNVLKEEMEAHKPSPDSNPDFENPDGTSTWNLILPALFGNPANFVPDLIAETLPLSSTEGIPTTTTQTATTQKNVPTETVILGTKTESTNLPDREIPNSGGTTETVKKPVSTTLTSSIEYTTSAPSTITSTSAIQTTEQSERINTVLTQHLDISTESNQRPSPFTLQPTTLFEKDQATTTPVILQLSTLEATSEITTTEDNDLRQESTPLPAITNTKEHLSNTIANENFIISTTPADAHPTISLNLNGDREESTTAGLTTAEENSSQYTTNKESATESIISTTIQTETIENLIIDESTTALPPSTTTAWTESPKLVPTLGTTTGNLESLTESNIVTESQSSLENIDNTTDISSTIPEGTASTSFSNFETSTVIASATTDNSNYDNDLSTTAMYEIISTNGFEMEEKLSTTDNVKSESTTLKPNPITEDKVEFDQNMNNAVDNLIFQMINRDSNQTTIANPLSTENDITQGTTTILYETTTTSFINENADKNRYEEIDLDNMENSTTVDYESKNSLILQNMEESSTTFRELTSTDANTDATTEPILSTTVNIPYNNLKTDSIELENLGGTTASQENAKLTSAQTVAELSDNRTEVYYLTELSSTQTSDASTTQSFTSTEVEVTTPVIAESTQSFEENVTMVQTEIPTTSQTVEFVTVETVTAPSPKVEKPELHIINRTVSTTPKSDTTWTLVSTVLPHRTTTGNDQEKLQLNSVTSVDLVPKPLQGFGLADSTSGLNTDVFQFTELCNELAFSFWNSVTSGISFARSVVVSPFAATSILAMVFLGARGATSGEMNDILKLDDMVTFNPHAVFKNVVDSIEVSKKSGVANSVFVKELYSDKNKGKLLNFYKERVKQFYDGHVEEVNFKEISDVIRRRTNLLVKRQTWGKVTEYLKDNNLSVRPPLAAISANLFQTDCSEASVNGRDGELHFVVLPSIRQRKLVPIPAVVWRAGFLAGYEPGLDATAVAIGRKDQTISTIFVIPGQQGIAAPGDGLARLETRLIESAFKQNTWARLLRSLIPRPGLEVQIPRFSHKSVINATAALQRMGLRDLFNAHTADLKGLNGVAHELYLSDIIQVNTFATCGENKIDETHHSEIYPATTNRSFRRVRKIPQFGNYENSDLADEPRDYQRAFHDPLYNPSYLSLPLQFRPRQARLPDAPRLRFDRPFLYFVRHNPTGLLLHMGRFNPRLLP